MTRRASHRLQNALGYDKMEPCRRAVSGIHRFPPLTSGAEEHAGGSAASALSNLREESYSKARRRVTQHLITMNSHRLVSPR